MVATTTSNPRLAARRRAVHAAARQLGLDDATRRDMLAGVAGVRSTTELTLAACDKVLDHLSRLGAGKPGRAKPGQHPGQPHNLERVELLKKVEALLADMQLPWSYADAIARQQTRRKGGIERLSWVPDRALAGVIAALHNEKKKRLLAALGTLAAALNARGLTSEWARQQAEAMGRLSRPWPWHQCLETLRLITARVHESGEAQ